MPLLILVIAATLISKNNKFNFLGNHIKINLLALGTMGWEQSGNPPSLNYIIQKIPTDITIIWGAPSNRNRGASKFR